MSNHICIVCQSPLTGRQTNACSRQCANKVYTNNRRESGKLRGPKPRKHPFNCVICDKPGIGTKPGTTRHAYCQRIATVNKAIRLSKCAELVRVPHIPQQKTTTIVHGSFWWAGTCVICNANYISKTGTKTCSDICQTMHRDEYKYQARHRRRVRQTNNAGRYTRRQIFERDNWTCQICLFPVPHNQTWNNNTWQPLFPTIDHIIPLSHGGEHNPNNMRLAHMQCNSSRSDRVSWEPDIQHLNTISVAIHGVTDPRGSTPLPGAS